MNANARSLAGLMLALALIAVAATPTLAQTPQPRSPQVAIGGTGLQVYLVTVGESIDVLHDQIIGELARSTVFGGSTFTILLELGQTSSGTVFGLYNGHDANPVLMPLFPATATTSWFAVVSYRTSPTRATMNVFDEFATLRSTQTILGADRNAIGFYASGPAGTFYSQDHLNPGGAAQCLFFRGTGVNAGTMWLALEGQPFASGDRDFDDQIVFLESGSLGSTPGIVDNVHTSWGQLKTRFR